MMHGQTPITGNEDKKKFSGPMLALIEFYDAFNNRDLDKMSKNWAQNDEITKEAVLPLHPKRLLLRQAPFCL
jgi:hypothetical protein